MNGLSSPFPYSSGGFRRMSPMADRDCLHYSTTDAVLQLANLGLSENNNNLDSGADPLKCGDNPKYLRINRLSGLPLWALDENREIRSNLTLKKVVDEKLVLMFAMDKSGCHFLQSNYYGEHTQQVEPFLRERITREVLGSKDVFLMISKNIFGNFFLQRVIEYSEPMEQELIKRYIVSDITALCLDKSACRVVQTALEKLEPRYADAIVSSLPRNNYLMAICIDQNANHVIQKVIKKMPLSKWDFIITYLCKSDHENLLDVCQDKYGCRVVQTIVEVLSMDSGMNSDSEDKIRALKKLMSKIVEKSQQLSSNEFANYVIQHIIECPLLSDYRNIIIAKCLLRNLLSMAQEKYASHVVEKAFSNAPLPYIVEMMEEIFDGYIPHPDTGKDALDILLFHQFGNYVVQRMLQICVRAVLGERDTIISGRNCRDKFEGWLSRLYLRARKESGRLARFSSGKKILDILGTMENEYKFTPTFGCSLYSDDFHSLCPPSSSMFSQSNTTSLGWNSRKSSFSSEHRDLCDHHDLHDHHD